MGFRRKYYDKNHMNKRDITEQVKSNQGSNEGQIKSQEVQDGISKVAMKDLPKSSYAIKSDPYAELNQASLPYDFIKGYNSKYQASYKGKENIDGGYVSQYLTAVDSRLLNVFDAAKTEIGINYRYLNISHRVLAEYDEAHNDYVITGDDDYETKPLNTPQIYDVESDYRGSQILRKMYDAINEAVSQLDATTFTYLKLNTAYSVISTLCIAGVGCHEYFMDLGDTRARTEAEGEGDPITVYTKVYCYTDIAAVILLSSLEYQVILQSGLGVLKQINKMKNSFGTLVKMNYQRETDPINQYFGLLNKAAFKQLLESTKLCIMGEYVDADWARNTNILTQLLSRKADDMIDPILEIDGSYNMQRVFVMISQDNDKFPSDSQPQSGELHVADFQETAVWMGGVGSDARDCRKASVVVNATTNRTVSLRPLTTELNRLLSPVETLAWSRHQGQEGVATPTARYNNIVYDIEGVDKILTKLKTRFGDLRTIYDKLSPLGLVNYIKGVTVDITDDFNVKPVDYMLIDDVFKTLLGGNLQITFSAQTGRWTGWSLWNKFTGIPLYDAKSGGAFLSFCTKQFDLRESVRSDYQYLPVMFTALSASDPDLYRWVSATNRLGDIITVIPQVSTAMGESAGLSRLAILPNFDTYDFKAPYVYSTTSDTQINADMAKMMLMSLADCFYDDEHLVYDINDDIIAIYNYEIDPIQKAMVTYAKAFGPIKGVTDADADMGFAGLSSISKR